MGFPATFGGMVGRVEVKLEAVRAYYAEQLSLIEREWATNEERKKQLHTSNILGVIEVESDSHTQPEGPTVYEATRQALNARREALNKDYNTALTEVYMEGFHQQWVPTGQ